METILKVCNLTKKYDGPGVRALENVSFEVDKGEMIGVIGPSGAGKSTLLRCINRLVEPSSGTITIEGLEITSLPQSGIKSARRRVGMIFQHYNLVNRLTVMQNVMHGRLGYMNTFDSILGRYSEQDKKKAVELLEMTGLYPFMYQRAGNLSGGQKQRVGIVRALMQNPSLLLCDEPIASLDPASSHIIMDLIRNLSKEHSIACIVNLHQVDVAIEYCDRIIGMKAGKVIYDGPAKQLSSAEIEKIYDKPIEQLMLGGEAVNAV